MLYASPDTPYAKLIKPFLEKKKKLKLDFWGKCPSNEMKAIIKSIHDLIERESPTAKKQYPPSMEAGPTCRPLLPPHLPQ